MASQVQNASNVTNQMLLVSFVAFNALAGLLCFLLERDWSHGLSAHSKVPLYMLLGSCLAFSVNFATLDVLARIECFQDSHMLVRAEWQVRVVAFTSLATGAFYGMAFGVLDVEDAMARSPAAFRAALNREAQICYPLGASSGAFAAIAARLLEMHAERSDPDLAYSRRSVSDAL